VDILVEDDGAGLDLARIRAVAAARGLVAADEALSDAEAADLIFASGFSTARRLTEISGRGVGLDAVRAAMTRLGGRVRVESRPGAGVTLRMTAPLRTLLTRIVIFTVGREQFGAPLRSIREMVRVRRSEVMEVRAKQAIVVREEVTPLFPLAALVGGNSEGGDTFPALIVETGQGPAAIAVDRVDVVLQAPVQPAGSLLSGLKGVAGSFLREDGNVVLLLDLAALAS
jgi:two-component system chemotaxis sensor kinase CheA